MKYRKKPVVIEAFQMTLEHRQDNTKWPNWLHSAWNNAVVYPVDYPNSNGADKLQIVTLEGVLTVDWGDYIIQGVKGELYPCKPDIFEATYEDVDFGDLKASITKMLTRITDLAYRIRADKVAEVLVEINVLMADLESRVQQTEKYIEHKRDERDEQSER